MSAQKRTLQETNKKMRKPLFKVKISLSLLETTIIMELQVIQNKIYEFRGQKIMFDFDLAQLYGVETAQLKRSVKRNMERFEGEDFMFEVTREELSRCQIGILNKGRGSNIKYLPFAFTELGVAMLSSVLHSSTAIEVNRNIMRAFVSVRQYLSSTNNTTKEIEELKQRMKVLEDGNEDTIAAINDLSEDTRKELDDIYLALSQLADKQKQIAQKNKCKPIGFVHYDNKK